MVPGGSQAFQAALGSVQVVWSKIDIVKLNGPIDVSSDGLYDVKD